MMPHIQEFIHRLEVGEGSRWVRGGVALLAFLATAGLFLLFESPNLSNPVAMDAVQVARQIARGEGFSTRLIRPWSVHLLAQHAAEGEAPENAQDPGRLRSAHPDLAHPPLYPLLLAAGLKLTQASFEITDPSQFEVYAPDRLVVLFNLLLLLALAVTTYALARRLFDGVVAALATVALLGAEVPWTAAAGGDATTLATLLVTLLALCLVRYDEAARNEDATPLRPWAWAALAGAVTGLAGLTHYGLLVLAVPLAAFLLPVFQGRTWRSLLAALLALSVVVTPWLVRNYQLSGQCFGTASAALLRDSQEYPGDSLERSLTTDVGPASFDQSSAQLRRRLGEVMQKELPTLGGSWVSAFFLVGLMFSFANPTRNALRGFLALGLVALLPLQALLGPASGRESVIPGTDYLVVLAPLVIVFGTAFFVSLLENMDWQVEGIRGLAIGGFVVVVVAPLVLLMLPPTKNPSAYPPYYPPWVSQIAEWVNEDEMMMSDVPWAVAWYADRNCMWLTQKVVDPKGREDIFAIIDFHRSLAGLYLTQLTTDEAFFSQMQDPQLLRKSYRDRAERESQSVTEDAAIYAIGWPELVLRSLTEGWLPEGFPFVSAHKGYVPFGQLLVMDRPRWNSSDQPQEDTQ